MGMEKTAFMKKWAKIMGHAVCAVSVIFVLAALVRTDFDVSWVTDWRAFLLVSMAGVCFKTATVFLSAGAWCLWLEFFAGRRCSRREAVRVYAKANIGKYLPGNVMHYVERNLFARKLQLSQKQIAAASICEVISLVLAAFLLGACLDFADFKEALRAVMASLPFADGVIFRMDVMFWIGVAAAVACMVFVAVYLLRLFKKKPFFEHLFSKRFFRTFLKCFLCYAAVLWILGAIFAAFYLYLGGRPGLRQALQIIAAYMIAWVLGFVVPGAPGGIGVREMALTLLLAPVMGRDKVVVLGVLHRLVTVIGDFAAYLLRKA
ncbi:MAG: lysylphosphatidylglycerol synthase domain-containing protein [Eubacterium sp.]|nr:lysylphosphatidylglycerol synthase domain-containing protein [Eubacterium sp.]